MNTPVGGVVGSAELEAQLRDVEAQLETCREDKARAQKEAGPAGQQLTLGNSYHLQPQELQHVAKQVGMKTGHAYKFVRKVSEERVL